MHVHPAQNEPGNIRSLSHQGWVELLQLQLYSCTAVQLYNMSEEMLWQWRNVHTACHSLVECAICILPTSRHFTLQQQCRPISRESCQNRHWTTERERERYREGRITSRLRLLPDFLRCCFICGQKGQRHDTHEAIIVVQGLSLPPPRRLIGGVCVTKRG